VFSLRQDGPREAVSRVWRACHGQEGEAVVTFRHVLLIGLGLGMLIYGLTGCASAIPFVAGGSAAASVVLTSQMPDSIEGETP